MTMPDEQIGVDLNVDSTGYVTGMQQALGPTQALQVSIGQLHQQGSLFRGFWSNITPGRAEIAGMNAYTSQAANLQQMLAPLAASERVTGQSARELAAGKTTIDPRDN